MGDTPRRIGGPRTGHVDRKHEVVRQSDRRQTEHARDGDVTLVRRVPVRRLPVERIKVGLVAEGAAPLESV